MDLFFSILIMFLFVVYTENSTYEHYIDMGIIRGEHESDRNLP